MHKSSSTLREIPGQKSLCHVGHARPRAQIAHFPVWNAVLMQPSRFSRGRAKQPDYNTFLERPETMYTDANRKGASHCRGASMLLEEGCGVPIAPSLHAPELMPCPGVQLRRAGREP